MMVLSSEPFARPPPPPILGGSNAPPPPPTTEAVDARRGRVMRRPLGLRRRHHLCRCRVLWGQERVSGLEPEAPLPPPHGPRRRYCTSGGQYKARGRKLARQWPTRHVLSRKDTKMPVDRPPTRVAVVAQRHGVDHRKATGPVCQLLSSQTTGKPPPPRVTFRLVVVSLRGPGQSPVLPVACCVGSLRSVSRCGRCSCWCRFRARGAQ